MYRIDGRNLGVTFTSPLGTLSYATSYDAAGRPLQVGSGTYWAANGAYDALGNLDGATRDSAAVNEAWATSQVSGLPQGSSVAIAGAAAGSTYNVGSMKWRGQKLASVVDSLSGTTYSYGYSNTGRLTGAKALPTGSSTLQQNSLVCLSYNVSKKFEPGPTFGNIERSREGLATASTPVNLDYLYSGTDVNASGLPAPPHAGGPDAPSSIGPAAAQTALGYDDYGRIVTIAGTAQQFTYDLLGRMTSATRTSGASETFSYDALGGLVSRRSGTAMTFYVGRRATVTGVCSDQTCASVTPASIAVDVHVTLRSRRIASVRSGGANLARTLHYYRDRLGSVVATTRTGGSPAARAGANYRYSAHGLLQVNTETLGSPTVAGTDSEVGYAGSLRLSGGLLLMGARVYNPALKIWMQPDPIEPFKYDYADGDPINKIDPTGFYAVNIVPVTLPGVGRTFLDKQFVTRIGLFVTRAGDRGVDVKFTSAYRSQAKQDELRANAAENENPVAEHSLHSAGLAVDTNWRNLKNIPGGLTVAQQRAAILEAAKDAGLKWGGDFNDPVHFQMGGLTNKDKGDALVKSIADAETQIRDITGRENSSQPDQPSQISQGGQTESADQSLACTDSAQAASEATQASESGASVVGGGMVSIEAGGWIAVTGRLVGDVPIPHSN